MQKQSSEIATIFNTRSFADETFCHMSEISNPTLNKLDLSAFVYARVYDNDTSLILHSDPRIANYVIANQLHVSAHVPENVVNDEFWFLPDPNGPYSKHIRALKELTTSNSFANYIRRFDGYYEMFSFLAPVEQSVGSSLFINKKEVLEKFASDFTAQAQDLILCVDQDRFKLTETMQPNFRGLESEEQINNISLQVYLAKIQRELIKIGSYISPRLSPQELNCIAFLIQGKTASDIADQLMLSQRTVETYLNSIRTKLGCRKKSDIVATLISISDKNQ